jgi:hypothetical protein
MMKVGKFFLLASYFVCLLVQTNRLTDIQALADANLSALPTVGSSQTYRASENGMMYQDGTLTISRVTTDSVHVTTSNGLPAFDQALSVDERGSMQQQPSAVSPFIDLLNYVAAILAAAPAGAREGAQWSVSLSGMSPIEAARQGFSAGTKYAAKNIKSVDIPIVMSIKLVSVSGNVWTFHGEGSQEKYTSTIGGNMGESINTTIDFVIKSGVLQSGTRTTILGEGSENSPMKQSFVTSLTAK